MKFEYVILLILAFNVVTALVKKRKAEAARLPEKAAKAPPPPDPRKEVGRARDAYAPAETVPAEIAEPRKPKGGLGRDLMEQLAKELGLETAEPERPRPEVVYKEASPEAARVSEVVAVVPPATMRAPRRVTAPLAGATPAAPPEPAISRSAPALELRDREGLRRAFIAKEVLGAPVSRRAPGRSARA